MLVLVGILIDLAPFADAADKIHSDDRSPNILWIVGENLKLDLGCYGAKNVKTPVLDGLAKKGVRYTHVFSTSPVCAPSRGGVVHPAASGKLYP